MVNDAPFIAGLVVERYLAGVRIDSFLLRHFRNYTPFRMQRMVHAGLVQVDGVAVPVEFRVRRGQQVTVRLTEPPDKLLASEPAPLSIVFEDAWLLVIDKSAGQIAHPVGLHNTGTLCNAVQFHLDQQTSRPGLLRPGIVHRLDRYTSGLMVVTKEHLSHRRLSIDFQRSKVAKEYVAIVDGVIEEDRIAIDFPIGQAAHPACVLMSCRADARDPRPARTQIEVLRRFADHTVVRARPLTGRNHQIRVHLAAIGHPVTADEFYEAFGGITPTRFDLLDEERPLVKSAFDSRGDSSPILNRHALHASRIAFPHPITREPMAFETPLPADMRSAIDWLTDSETGRRWTERVGTPTV
jgi:23S rRNA pseudouridine1911/1915/1917 synthase